jgi:hypothetical protein
MLNDFDFFSPEWKLCSFQRSFRDMITLAVLDGEVFMQRMDKLNEWTFPLGNQRSNCTFEFSGDVV